jgi:S1-C subfamily serine protease
MLIIPVDEDLIIEAVEKVGRSVVNIASVRMVQDQLFPIEGVGSGIIIGSKGLVLTNNHVIDKVNVRIGISAIKITRQLAQYYKLPSNEGVLIAQVEPQSPAEYADLRKGDIIEAIDGNKITDPSQMSSNIRKRAINEKIIVTINRYGRRFDCRIQLLARR